jgi:hypothetical protein
MAFPPSCGQNVNYCFENVAQKELENVKARHDKEQTKKLQSEEDAGFAKFYSDR